MNEDQEYAFDDIVGRARLTAEELTGAGVPGVAWVPRMLDSLSSIYQSERRRMNSAVQLAQDDKTRIDREIRSVKRIATEKAAEQEAALEKANATILHLNEELDRVLCLARIARELIVAEILEEGQEPAGLRNALEDAAARFGKDFAHYEAMAGVDMNGSSSSA